MLEDLISHFADTSNRSMLARIYGVYTLKSNIFSDLNIIVMQNTAKMKNPQNPKMVFDLKGSTIGRYTKLEEDNFWLRTQHQRRVMKDINLLEINSSTDNKLLNIEQEEAEYLAMLL